ncbi:hypothetical protein Q4E93_31450 [Flavitalea sp. BT771]|uniref:hypothetical protein n=1 Tax=Flavitalea sp. BT771 TaxID=3063329 RepID=UPI0026E3F2BF|nr:hypothetical protein [Flavitalea sp. BT771]MDO6435174.1 hypothetical protein [Flavitalea sp. BT771]MDV6224121.1 hypothetical protein [Flavitalea sp. BT771]
MNLFSVSTLSLALIMSVPAPAPREWVKEKDQINGRISRTQLTKMQRTTDDMIAFLHDSCFSDIDFSPIWHGEYSSGKFGIQCRTANNKSQLAIMANDFSPLLRYLTVNGKEVAGIRPVAGIQDDCRYFEYENEDQVRTITWLVTNKREQLPYIEITRKEYLQEARAELNKIKDGIIADVRLKTPVRGAAIQEAEKKASIDELSSHYSGTDLQVRMRLFQQNYQSDEAYLQGAIHQATAHLDKTLRLMDSLALRSTAVELNKPAMVSVEAIDFRGFEDNAADRNMLVRMNPAYFNASLSGERAQLFLVSWSYDPADAGSVSIDRAIREHIDFGQLQEMLGK